MLPLTQGKPILVVGSINMDLVAGTEKIPAAGETVLGDTFETHPGGKGANQAVAIGRLGHPVQLIGRLGSDHFTRELRQSLEAANVDTSGVKELPGSCGVAVILVTRQGENCIVVTPGANASLHPSDLDAYTSQIRHAGAVLAQLETPLETIHRLAEICRDENVPFILDPAPAIPLPPSLLQLVTWFTPNDSEAAFYTRSTSGSNSAQTPQELAQQLLAQGIANVLLKRGEQGFHIATATGLSESHPALPVRAVDTTAAGDAFNGAFAAALVSGNSPVDSARFAAAAAAVSVTRKGAQPSMPTREEVNQLMKANESTRP